jgi:hypothetical protein
MHTCVCLATSTRTSSLALSQSLNWRTLILSPFPWIGKPDLLLVKTEWRTLYSIINQSSGTLSPRYQMAVRLAQLGRVTYGEIVSYHSKSWWYARPCRRVIHHHRARLFRLPLKELYTGVRRVARSGNYNLLFSGLLWVFISVLHPNLQND